jgi:hypothetical protein
LQARLKQVSDHADDAALPTGKVGNVIVQDSRHGRIELVVEICREPRT